jgi:hypothetical protein
MREIRHRDTGVLLRRLDVDTLEGVDLRGCNLRGASLPDANLQRADLTGADLGGADLECADLRGAKLTAANLGGAKLAGAHLTWARYDCTTRWPRNFDPRKRGCVRGPSPGELSPVGAPEGDGQEASASY